MSAVPAALDARLSQRLDLPIHSAQAMEDLTSGEYITDLLWHDNSVWAATEGGVVRWNPDDGSYRKFTSADGLASNSVTKIAADTRGLLWFTTVQGVSSYDPASGAWRTLPTGALPANTKFSAVAAAPDGTLWFGGATSSTDLIGRYDPQNQTWQIFTEANGVVKGGIKVIALDKSGAVWSGSNCGGGLSRYDPLAGKWFTFTVGTACGPVTAIRTDTLGNVWASTTGGLYHYIQASAVMEKINAPGGWGMDIAPNGDPWIATLTGNQVVEYFVAAHSWSTVATPGEGSSLMVDPLGRVWVGTFNLGLARIDGRSVARWYHTTDKLPNNNIGAVATDSSGRVWFATGTGRNGAVPYGVSRYDPASGAWQSYNSANSGLVGTANSMVSAIAVDRQQRAWFATIRLNEFDPLANTWRIYSSTNGLPSNSISGLASDPTTGGVWVATSAGAARYDPASETWQTFLKGVSVAGVAVSSNGDVWFTTNLSNEVRRYLPATNTWRSYSYIAYPGLVRSPSTYSALAADKTGGVWVGASTKGVSHYDPATDNWQAFTTIDGVAGSTVTAIAGGDDGDVWIGTYSNGLSRYNLKTHAWKSYTTAQGLPDNHVIALASDAQGGLWAATTNGVAHLQGQSPQSDLSVQLGGPTAVFAGQAYSYSLALDNHGQIAAAATLTLTLPNTITYLGASRLPARSAPLAWDLGSVLTDSAPLTLTVQMRVPADGRPGALIQAAVQVRSSSAEAFLDNNTASSLARLQDPASADLRISGSGPSVLIAGKAAAYTLWVDNNGGLEAAGVQLKAAAQDGLLVSAAAPPPTTLAPLTWEVGRLASGAAAPWSVVLTMTAAADLPSGVERSLTATVTTLTPERNLEDNTAAMTVRSALQDARTLILVAPSRLARRYGASDLLSRLYLLARHPAVQGIVLDVERDPATAQAYHDWDNNVQSWARANALAEKIKAQVFASDGALPRYPNLRYLVLVGDDEMLPFYRLADQNSTFWHETRYRENIPSGSLRAALAADRLLTDDFYAARAPTQPASPFWLDRHPLYLPDLAVGRLVGQPDEMLAAIQAFLDNNGVIPLAAPYIGVDQTLAGDLGQAQSQALQSGGMAASLTNDPDAFRSQILALSGGSLWGGFHSNHFSLGSLTSSDIQKRPMSYARALLSSIGCHAGLPAPAPRGWPNLAQAFEGRGGVYIGATSYAYGSQINIGYSEALMLEFTQQLMTGQAAEIGPALTRAKQAYYAGRGWFDYLDEKVLLPMTLYGLPMTRVSTAALARRQPSPAPYQVFATQKLAGGQTLVSVRLQDLSYHENRSENGVYYDYNGQTLDQDGLPVQPYNSLPFAASLSGQVLRSARLESADYTAQEQFNPLTAQSWAFAEPMPSEPAQPRLGAGDWDRSLPYSLGQFDGMLDQNAALNLALGAYYRPAQRQILFTNLTLDLIYSDSQDQQKPLISSLSGYLNGKGGTAFTAQVSDDGGVSEARIVFDDGVGGWRSLALTPGVGQVWSGEIPAPAARFYLQALDKGGNLSASDWQPVQATPPAVQAHVYMPTVQRSGR